MPRSKTPVEVIQDSEDELPKSSKKKSVDDAQPQSGDEADEAAEGSEPEEEEYEIEAILEAKHGAFPGGRMGYLVKWKGYDEEHNSWVDQADAANAQALIDDYWERTKKNKKSKPKQPKARTRKSSTKDDSPVLEDPTSRNKRKKSVSGQKSKSTQPDEMDDEDEEEKPRVKKAKKARRPKERSEERMDVDEDIDEPEYKPLAVDSKYRNQKSWENLVAQVDTIEKIEGTLKVFFTLNNGDKVVETSQECAKHFPQKLIQFYESNLRWRESEV